MRYESDSDLTVPAELAQLLGQLGQMAVPADRVTAVVEAIIASAKTGQIGDGKIFVTTIDQAVRIRTGETDADAL